MTLDQVLWVHGCVFIGKGCIFQMPASGSFQRGELKECIRNNFLAEAPAEEDKAAARLDLVCELAANLLMACMHAWHAISLWGNACMQDCTVSAIMSWNTGV